MGLINRLRLSLLSLLSFLPSRYMPNFHVRIHRPYADCSGIFTLWAERAISAVVFEHPADDKAKRTHCHGLIYGIDVKAEAMKRMWKDKPNDLSGNGEWSLVDTYKEDNQDLQITWESRGKALTYLTKGHLEEKFLKNISKQEVDEARSKWVNYKSPDLKKASSKKQKEEKQEIMNTIKNCYNTTHKCDKFCEPSIHLNTIYDLTIQELNKRKIRWHVYDLDRYVLPIFTDVNDFNRVSLVAELVRRHFRQ